MFKHTLVSDGLCAESTEVLEALEGLEIELSIDENDPDSVARAISLADAAIDARLVVFHENDAVHDMIVAIKAACRAAIFERACGPGSGRGLSAPVTRATLH